MQPTLQLGQSCYWHSSLLSNENARGSCGSMVWLWPDRLCDSTLAHDQYGTNWNSLMDVPERLALMWNELITRVGSGSSGCFFFFSSLHSFVLVLLPESCRPRSEPMSFFQGIKLVMGHGPYAKLVMVFLFTSLAFMVGIEIHTILLQARLVRTVSKSQLLVCSF